MQDTKTLTLEIVDKIAIITLNRPDNANGINLELAQELVQAAQSCEKNETIKAVIITAEGRFFSAGGDIKEMASHGEKIGEEITKLADTLSLAVSTFSRMKAPIITAVNGLAAGAGFSLAIIGDIVIASHKANFVMSYTNAGLCPDGGASYFLPRLIGMRRAQELMLTNRMLEADEAFDWGIATELVMSDRLMERALTLATAFAEGPMQANSAVKTLLLSSFDNSLEDQMKLESKSIGACAMTPDGREGVAAFIDKRKPVFK